MVAEPWRTGQGIDMEDFAAKVIAAHQAGLAESRQQKILEQQAEDHKLNVQIKKHELDAAKIQQGLQQRQLDAITSGGPQQPLPQNMQDLLTQGRQQAQPQMAPIPQDLSGGAPAAPANLPTPQVAPMIATQNPPVPADIQIPLSDGTIFKIPRTTLENENARAMAQKIQELRLESLKPYTLAPEATRVNPLEGTSVTGQEKPAELQLKDGTINGVPVTANFNPKTGKVSVMGQDVTAQFKPKETGADEAHNTVTTNAGVFQYNPAHKAYDIRVGDRPQPEASALAAANLVEKSYEFHTTKFANLAKPIQDKNARFQTLTDALNAGTPMADALIAPQLLTLVAGGQGSGLRMNEAEISRIVGGRSKWESIKAGLNAWNTDPKKANSILESQRGQIQDLVKAIGAKLQAKEQILSGAQQQLADTQNPAEHKQIYSKAQTTLDALDSGGTVTMIAPDGKTTKQVPADQIQHFLSLGAKIK